MNHAPPAPMLPAIVCLDLDNTLIGNIKYQVCEWELLKKLDRHSLKAFRKNLAAQLSSTWLVRPFLKHFLTKLTHRYPGVVFYVYTASDKQWAKELVPLLEKVLQFQFHRPIFTRDHCLAASGASLLGKSIPRIAPAILRSLRRQHPTLTLSHIMDNTVLIDNLAYTCKTAIPKQLLCWSYDFTVPQDVLRLLPEEVVRQKVDTIAKIMTRYGVIKPVGRGSDYSAFLAAYYAALGRAFATTPSSTTDTFWKVCAEAWTQGATRANGVPKNNKALRALQDRVDTMRSKTT